MHSAVLSRSVIGDGSLIAAGAVVLEGQEIPAKSLAAGVPAKVRRELSDEQSGSFIPHAARYVQTAAGQASPEQALSLDEVRFS
jgi:carbonic anhydrase/acetyltransferase-like protein (isoleucine patch superfamily)